MLSRVSSLWPDDAVQNWIETSQFSGGLGFRLRGYDRTTDTLMGVVGIGPKLASLMYVVDQDHWGKGLTAQACRMILVYVFDRFAPDAIKADCFTDNPASAHILTKLGFQAVGKDFGNSAARVDAHPIILYRLRRDDYESQKR